MLSLCTLAWSSPKQSALRSPRAMRWLKRLPSRPAHLRMTEHACMCQARAADSAVAVHGGSTGQRPSCTPWTWYHERLAALVLQTPNLPSS